MNTKMIINAGSLALCVVAISGCTSMRSGTSGFLGNYDDMQKKGLRKNHLVYKAPVSDECRAVILEPIVFDEKVRAKLNAKVLESTRHKLEQSLVEQFEKRFEVVQNEGPGVVTIRTAVSDMATANPYVNVVTTLGAYLPLDMGGIVVEMEAVNSVSKKRVAALVDKRRGTPFMFFQSFQKTGHAQARFNSITKEMVEMLRSSQIQPKIQKALVLDDSAHNNPDMDVSFAPR